MDNIALMVVLLNPNKQEIENIINYTKYIKHVYVIDNSSCKHNHFFEGIKNITYYTEEENKGIAWALNVGCHLAIKDNFSWLITMDQDTFLDKQHYLEIIKECKDKDLSQIFIVSPWLDTKLFDINPGGIDHPQEVMTSCSFMNLSIFQEVGDFDESLFIDGVDIEYCLRCGRKGYKIMRLNDISVKHNLGNIKHVRFLNKKRTVMNHNADRKYYMARNFNYLYDEYPEYTFLDECRRQRNVIIKIWLYENDKIKKTKAIIQGIRDYKKGIKGKRS